MTRSGSVPTCAPSASITGLAGTLKDHTLRSGERKYALSIMKESYRETTSALANLSEKQLAFTPEKKAWSVRDCFYHLTATEQVLWSLFEKLMRSPANPEKRHLISYSDQEWLSLVDEKGQALLGAAEPNPSFTGYKNFRQAWNQFRKNRLQHIRYMRTSTEDLRNHVIELPAGWADGYQLYLLIAAHSRLHTRQILDLKEHKDFPAR